MQFNNGAGMDPVLVQQFAFMDADLRYRRKANYLRQTVHRPCLPFSSVGRRFHFMHNRMDISLLWNSLVNLRLLSFDVNTSIQQ